jgi:hypothetical protein
MAVARPVVLVGPDRSHVGDLLAREQIGWRVAHGDVDGMVALLRSLADGDRGDLESVGRRARAALQQGLGKEQLCGRLCDIIERGTAASRASS